MANINGTNLAAPIVPFTTNDTFPTHYAKYGKGGYRTVATITERDGIFTALREEGMEVYVVETSKKYALVGGISNTNWVERISNVAGSNTQVMFNDSGVLSGNNQFTYNKTTGEVRYAGNRIDNTNYSIFLGIGAGGTYANSYTGIIPGGCTIIGSSSLYSLASNSNLNRCTTLGYRTLYSATTANYCLALGHCAGFTETNADYKLIAETNETRNSNKDYLIEGDFNYRWVRFNGALRKRVVNITSTSSLNSGTATSATTNSVTDTTKTFTVNEFKNKFLIITGGVGIGQAMLITSNTTTTITTTKNFTVTPDNTSTYKIINGTILLGENLNSEYLFDLTNGDYVINLPSISLNYSGANADLCIKTNPSSNKLYILTTSTNKISPDNVDTTYMTTPYKVSNYLMNDTTWTRTIRYLQNLKPIKSSTKDLVIDLYSKIYKIDVATATTVTFNIDSSYTPILTDNSLTIELDINMTVASAITWPNNITWIGGVSPTFDSIGKYRLVFRTEDMGTSWLGNLAYTY